MPDEKAASSRGAVCAEVGVGAGALTVRVSQGAEFAERNAGDVACGPRVTNVMARG